MELSNGIIKLDFDDRNGNLLQITDIGSGRTLLSDPRGSRLFKLVVPTSEDMSRPIFSHEQRKIGMKKNNEHLTITFPELKAGEERTGVSATVSVRLPAGSSEALFSIEAHNGGPDVVHEVHCPWVGGWTGFAGTGVDSMLVAGWPVDPHGLFPRHRVYTFGGNNVRKHWDGMSTLPFMDISGGGCGLSYCVYSNVPRLAAFVVEDLSPDYGRTCLSWAYVGRPYLKPGQTWKSPEIGVGVHKGDWHETVDRYRSFYERWWKSPPTPLRFRKSIGFHNVQFRGFNGEFYHDFDELPAVAQDGIRYGVSDLCIWDLISQVYIRPDTGGYWEATPERLDALRRGLSAARKLGCNVSTLVNFRLVTVRNKMFDTYAPELQRSIYGQPLINESYPCGMNHAAYFDRSLEAGGRIVCQSSERFKEIALGVARQTMSLGFTSLFIDQANENHCCFDESHGHTSPDDTPERSLEWISEAADMVRSLSPDAYVIGENPDLFNTQILDTSWLWCQRDSIRKPEVIRYLLPDSLQLWCIDEHERDVIGRAFASGHQFALMVRRMSGLLSEEPELAENVARLASLRADTADYLATGRFLDNRGLDVDGGLGYSYSSEAGLAVGLANPEPRQAGVKIVLSPDALGKVPSAGGVLHIEGGPAREVSVQKKDGGLALEADLPPYGAAVWTIPCQPRA